MNFDQKVIEYVNLRLSSSSHDIEHAFRVYKLADEISTDIKSTKGIDKQALK